MKITNISAHNKLAKTFLITTHTGDGGLIITARSLEFFSLSWKRINSMVAIFHVFRTDHSIRNRLRFLLLGHRVSVAYVHEWNPCNRDSISLVRPSGLESGRHNYNIPRPSASFWNQLSVSFIGRFVRLIRSIAVARDTSNEWESYRMQVDDGRCRVVYYIISIVE